MEHENTHNLSTYEIHFSTEIPDLITSILLYAEMTFCFTLNSISLLFIISHNKITPINLLIINLAIADILYSSCIPFFVRQFSVGDYSQSKFSCRLTYAIDVTCMLIEVYTIAALAIERFMYLKKES